MMWTGSETRIDIVGVGDDEHAVGRTNREEATNKRARHGQVLVVVRVHEHLADGGSNPIPQKGSPNPSVISPTSSALRAAPHDCPALAGPALPHQAIFPGLLPPSGSARSAFLGLLNSYRHNVLLVPPAPSPSRKYASVQQPAARTLVQVNILAPSSNQPAVTAVQTAACRALCADSASSLHHLADVRRVRPLCSLFHCFSPCHLCATTPASSSAFRHVTPPAPTGSSSLWSTSSPLAC